VPFYSIPYCFVEGFFFFFFFSLGFSVCCFHALSLFLRVVLFCNTVSSPRNGRLSLKQRHSTPTVPFAPPPHPLHPPPPPPQQVPCPPVKLLRRTTPQVPPSCKVSTSCAAAHVCPLQACDSGTLLTRFVTFFFSLATSTRSRDNSAPPPPAHWCCRSRFTRFSRALE